MSKKSRKKKTSTNTPTYRIETGLNTQPLSQRLTTDDHLSKVVSKDTIIVVAIIMIFALAVYYNTLYNGFVYDDKLQVLENKWITDVRYLPDIFSTNVWSFQAKHTNSDYYRPLMHIIYMFNYHMFGLKAWGFHLVNMLFHAANSVLVFVITARLLSGMLNRQQTDKLTSWQVGSPASMFLSPAFIAAILFAVHPVHTEAVAWIGAVTDLSYTFFFLLSFYFYMKSGSRIKSHNYLFSLLFFALALLCKEPAAVLPVVIAVYDLAVDNNRESILVRSKKYIPYFIIAGIYLIVRVTALGSFAPVKAHANLTSYQYIINVFPLFALYIEKLVLPINLNAFHTLHFVNSLIEGNTLIALAITITVVVIGIFAYRKNRTVFFGLALIVAPLIPALYIPALGESPLAERYLYLPSVGFVILVAIFLSWINNTRRRVAYFFVSVSIGVAALYAFGTVARNEVWKNDYTLWSDTVEKSPGHAFPREGLGNALMSLERVDEAIAQYKIALRMNPRNENIMNNLGRAYFKKGSTDAAIREFQSLTVMRPDFAEAYYNLGCVYASKGMIDEAIGEFQTAIKIKPDYLEAVYNLGVAFMEKGLLDKAVTNLDEAMLRWPAETRLRALLNRAIEMKHQSENRPD
jgi:tetratricopeptide (TPR) repeat protein